jgi:hypothetical protein
MSLQGFRKEDGYLLNFCAKYLARYNFDYRHSYGPPGSTAPRDRIAEAWRFPLIDVYAGGEPALADPASFNDYNEVTFIYAGADEHSPASVAVIGTFATLYQPVLLERISFAGQPTPYWSITWVVPKGQVHTYRFLVDGAYPINDPINPQELRLDSGARWSRFFTDSFTSPLV